MEVRTVMFLVQRFDNNPKNYATFRSWVCVSVFPTRETAEAYVKRAQSSTQWLRVHEEWGDHAN